MSALAEDTPPAGTPSVGAAEETSERPSGSVEASIVKTETDQVDVPAQAEASEAVAASAEDAAADADADSSAVDQGAQKKHSVHNVKPAKTEDDSNVQSEPTADVKQEDATTLAVPIKQEVAKSPTPQVVTPEVPTALPQQIVSTQGQTLKLSQMTPEQRRHVFEERVQAEPRDGEAWLALIEEAQSRGDLDATRGVYTRFFKVFPNQSRQWIAYADLELAHSNFAQVEAIFTQCLRSTPSVDLWRFYLSYTRRVNPLPPPAGGEEDGPREQARRLLEGAYEFALKFVGMDKDSGSIWTEYIALIKEREAKGGWKEGQKMDDLRRVYQRAVSVPLANIEAIWKDYDAYENGLNKLTAKKFLAERSPAYMTARRVLRDLRVQSDSLPRPLLPRVPAWATSGVPGAAGADAALWSRERSQIEAWKEYLKWEESNPLLIEDPPTLQARVVTAYRKATMFLRFYPEVWFLASRYLIGQNRQDEAATWLKNGMDACTGSFLLNFAYVELCEARKSTADCAAVFDSLISHIYSQIETRQKSLTEDLMAISSEVDLIRAQAASRRQGDGAAEIDGEEREQERKAIEQVQTRKQELQDSVAPEIEGLKEASALVCIKYMHFLRRVDGIRAARGVFSRARKSVHCTWQVFEASALMEYHCSKDAVVATKVFELALKTFGHDEAFVVRYLNFLIAMNDDNNARALFERVIGTFSPERARPIWDTWSTYEYNFGDSVAIQKLENRLAETYADEPATKRFVDRNSYMDLELIGPRDLGFQAQIAGASAADRAVQAANTAGGVNDEGPRRKTMQEMKRFAAESSADDTNGNWARPGQPHIPTGPAAMVGGPPAKRFKRDSASPVPTGPKSTVPPTGPRAALNVRDAYREFPEGVLMFLDMLPSAGFFDGPKIQPDDIIESLRHANLPSSQGPPSGPTGFVARPGGGRFGR